MRKVDTNKLILVGKVASSKCWPPKAGKNFTNGKVKLIVDDDGGCLEVSMGLTVDKSRNRDDVDQFEKTFTRGRKVAILDGYMGGYENKNSKEYVFQAEGRLFDTAIAEDNNFINNVMVSGKVSKIGRRPDGSHGLVIEATYDAKKATPRWRTRQIKVLVPEAEDGSAPCAKGDRVFIQGSCEEGSAGKYVKAQSLTKIHG